MASYTHIDISVVLLIICLYPNGSQIIAEETAGSITVYIYDAEGQPLGMRYHGTDYAADTWDKRIAKAIKARFLITNFCHSFANPIVNMAY